ncbi:MAG: helix-turn-helix transcriptional regulator [Geothrix sp.]|nr:helix-turn-helix transcriptional regulator [Geothrix sp.]
MSEELSQGARLRQLRLHLGVGQVDFARAIGVPQSNLSPWESGKRSVPMPVLLAAASVYGASRAWILDGIGPMFESELNLSSVEEPPDGGIYKDDLAGMLKVMRESRRAASVDLLVRTMGSDRYFSIVRGHDLPTFGEVGTIARVLGVSPMRLLVHADGRPIVKSISEVDPLATILPRRAPTPLKDATLDAPYVVPKSKRKKPAHQEDGESVEDMRRELARLRKEVEDLKRAAAKHN